MERYSARPVVARVTLTKGTVEIVRIYEHLAALGFFEVGFAPVTAKNGDEYGLEPADPALGFKWVQRVRRTVCRTRVAQSVHWILQSQHHAD